MGNNIVEKVKAAGQAVANGVKKTVGFFKKIGDFAAFLTTPIGIAVGCCILAVTLIIFVYVISDVVQHQIGIWFKDDYAGISTTEDYDTIVAQLGYTGYDSFISEKNWQEYSAFEYAVLMDVAEHMYDNQEFITTLKTPLGEEYDTSAVIPEGIVHTEYNAGNPSGGSSGDDNIWWQDRVHQAQAGNPPTDIKQEDMQLPGGNRDVVRPWLIYEKATNEYDNAAVSLLPYLVVVREDMELNYFIQGLPYEIWRSYEKNLEDVEVDHLASYKRELEPVKFSPILNRFNYTMPSSAYKKDLQEYQQEKLGKENSGEVIADEDKEGFIQSDLPKGYKSDSIYYTEQETDIVYKIPLKLLVNRYLPKSTLLTAWYMLKRDDNEGEFEIDKLMEEIKEVYNTACYKSNSMSVPEIEVTKEINRHGVIVDLKDAENKLPSSKTIRIKEDKFDTATVETVQYDKYGAIKRNSSGEAEMTTKPLDFSTSNYRTFIYFEQFGLETSRYEKWKIYLAPSGDNEPHNIDEARPEEETPSVTYLTQRRVNFIETLNLTLYQVEYIDINGKRQIEDLKVRLKPSLSHIDELKEQADKIPENPEEDKVELSEKLKSLYLKDYIIDETATSMVKIEQEPYYKFMKEVVKKAEDIMKNHQDIERGGAVLDFINKLYIMAESGNSDKLLEKRNPEDKLDPDAILYRLAEDYRYYNQDDEMPHWYDLNFGKPIPGAPDQKTFEAIYLEAFQIIYNEGAYKKQIEDMLLKELRKAGYNPVSIESIGTSQLYTYEGESAKLYEADGFTHKSKASEVKDALEGNYQINYYWEAVHKVEVKTLQMKQKIHHRRMPVVLVKYCDSWAKSTEYNNYILQHSLDYRNHVFLIPESITSLGIEKMELNEKSSYRCETFKQYFNEKSGDKVGIKEGDVLDMLIQWEDYANKGGDESAYAYMRDLYKLTLFIRDSGQMYSTAYSYLYVPPAITNYDDETLQKIFWLERLGVTQGDDELTEEEQARMRVKAIETRWQNLEYDEYFECVYDIGEKEDAKIYALFPFGAPCVRAYYMLESWDNIIQEGGDFDESAGDGDRAHLAVDMYSRSLAKKILDREKR